MVNKGEVTISIEDFDTMREQARKYDPYAEAKAEAGIRREVAKMISFGEEEFTKRIKAINDMGRDAPDKEVNKKFEAALATITIYVDEKQLKRLIQKYIDPASGDTYADIKAAPDKALDKMKIKIRKRKEN